MLLRDVVDELHQRHGLADAGAAEQADLAALGDRHDQIDDLDARLEHLGRCRLFLVGRRLAVDGHPPLFADWPGLIDRVAEDVHDSAECLLADRHLDRAARIGHRQAARQALAGTHRDCADDAVAELLLDLECQVTVLYPQRIVDLR